MTTNNMENNSLPWSSTIPDQVPWMSSFAALPLSFGPQSDPRAAQNATSSGLLGQINAQQHISPLVHFAMASPSSVPVTSFPATELINSATSQGMIPNFQSNGTSSAQSSTQQHQTLPSHHQSIFNNFSPTFTSGAINLNEALYNQTCSTNVIQPNLTSSATTSNHKRSSVELEDDQLMADEPPTKQLLSEKNLFVKFGSLHIDGKDPDDNNAIIDLPDDDEDDDNRSQSTSENIAREEFNRYVYLLFKDKEESKLPFNFSNATMDRLAREERDKLSKAVILWNPPTRFHSFSENDDLESDDEGEFRYTDHKDFLKKTSQTEDSLVITDVTDDPAFNSPSSRVDIQSDDFMVD